MPVLSVSLSLEELVKLKEYCDKNNLKPNKAIRLALQKLLSEIEAPK
jgi:hypothetical protein